MQSTTDLGSEAAEYVSKTVFTDVNDDCWMEIFEYLTLDQQVPLLKVCPRFRNLIHSLWKPKYKNLRLNFHEHNIKDNHFYILLEFLCDSIEKLHLEFLPVTKYQNLKHFKYRKVHELRFSQERPLYMNDNDMLVLQNIFPRLRTFSPQGDFSGKYMANWGHLEHLTLTHCNKICSLCSEQYFSEIFEKLHLKSVKLDCFIFQYRLKGRAFKHFCKLEKVHLDLGEALWLMRDLQRFKHLKELILTEHGLIGTRGGMFGNWNGIFNLIDLYKRNDLLQMEFANIGNASIVSCLNNFHCYSNLFKLSFVNATPEVILPLKSPNFLSHLPELRELHFYSCPLESETYILRLLREAKQLERVTFEECLCKFPMLKIDVSRIVDDRKKTLIFNYYENYQDLPSNKYNENSLAVGLELIGSSHLFVVTCKRSDSINYQPLRFVFRQQLD